MSGTTPVVYGWRDEHVIWHIVDFISLAKLEISTLCGQVVPNPDMELIAVKKENDHTDWCRGCLRSWDELGWKRE